MKAIVAGVAFFAAYATTPLAGVDIDVDLSTQRMHVRSSTASYDWPVSTALAGYETPTGNFAPQRLEAEYHSKKYSNAPMPHAIFFYYGFAIHGTHDVAHLGHPASHGCVRLAPADAAKLFSMVQAEGAAITISGTTPNEAPGSVVAAADGTTPGLLSKLGF